MMNIVNTYKNNFFFSQNNLINLTSFLIFIFPISIITGPFLPDLILSTVALIGLYLFLKKKIIIKFYKEILFLWIFYTFIIISSIISDQPIFSFDYSLFYFRFIIFSHFLIYLLYNFEVIKKLLLYGILTSLFLIICSSSYQLFLIYFVFDENIFRLRLPFSDEQIVGSFIIRILPILIFFLYLNKPLFKNNLFVIFLSCIVLLSIIVIIFSGERAAIIYLLIGSILTFTVFIKIRFKLSVIIFLSFSILLIFSLFNNQKLTTRIFQDFERHISLDAAANIYYNYSLVSIEMFKDSPLIGKGPKMFRVDCKDDKYNDYKNNCNMHPHNIYLQLLAETGSIGFLFLFVPYVLVSIKFFQTLFFNKTNKMFQLASIGFLINFFPLVPTGNFFNNWLNSLFYLPIILLVYSLYLNKNSGHNGLSQ